MCIRDSNKLTEIANDIQAVNTLIPEKNNQWIGAITDVQGFLTPLKDHNLKNKSVVVIGCGGSARAVVMGLSSLNIKKVTIISRNEKTLNIFVQSTSNLLTKRDISIESINNKKLNVSPYIQEADLIINTTPIGMNSKKSKQENVPLGNAIWNCLSLSLIHI